MRPEKPRAAMQACRLSQHSKHSRKFRSGVSFASVGYVVAYALGGVAWYHLSFQTVLIFILTQF
jgi:hypothetical protein